MTCSDAVDKLYDHIDRELDNVTAESIRKHLDLCKLCCDQFEFEKSIKELVNKCCEDAKAPSLLKQKIITSLNS